jgi:membrane protein DedA with SNARE-associated domain
MTSAHLSFEYLLETYGYAAVFIGTFLEGETILVLGGLAARIGHLELKGIILAAFLGTTLGDQLYFFIGRRYGKAILKSRPHWQEKTTKIDQLVNQYDVGLILSFRFMYGLRTIASFAFGMSSIPTRKFVILNMLGAAIWAVAIGGAGYLLGKSMELLVDDVKSHQALIFIGVISAGIAVWTIYYWRSRLKTQ